MSNPNDKILRKRLNRAAQTYAEASFLQQEVNARLEERLDYLKLQPKVILNIGAAIGTSARLLQKRYPKARIIAHDLAEELLKQYTHPWYKAKPWRLCASAEQLPLQSQSVDLIYSNLWLHWVDFPAAIKEFKRILKPGGLLLFTMPGPDSLKELRQSCHQVDTHAHVQEFVDMHHLADELLTQGWQDPVVDMEFLTLTYSALENLIADIRGVGASYLGSAHALNQTKWQAIKHHYEQWRVDGKLPATIEIIYGQAWLPPESGTRNINDAGEVAIPIHLIKRNTSPNDRGG